MKRMLATAVCAVLVLAGSATTATAKKTECDVNGNCVVTDHSVGSGGGGGGGGGAGAGAGKGSSSGQGCEVPVDGVVTPAWCTDDSKSVYEIVSPAEIARRLMSQVQLKPIKVGITPLAKSPDSMGLVGLPVWLWADDPSPTTWGPVTITAGGMSLTAQVSSVSWDMGDGTKFSCGKGTEWKKGMALPDGSAYPSPTCGHTYSKQGRYTISATSHWVAHWSGYGQSGDIPVTVSTSYSYVVAELQAIRVR